MSGRTILSRPRTRVYDANYNIGESYYRPALDRLDRKYSGRPLSPPRSRPGLPKDLLDRHDRVFADEDLSSSRRRAEKLISEGGLFDSRGGRISQRAQDFVDDFDDETTSTLKRIRANKKVSAIDDIDLENTVNSLNTRRMLERSSKLLQSVGIDDDVSVGRSRRGTQRDADVVVQKRSLKVSYEDGGDGEDVTRWSRLSGARSAAALDDGESAAALRARKSRDRINDIEEEMAAMAEKQAARERRAARLKALVAESTEETEATQSALQAISLKSRREQIIED